MRQSTDMELRGVVGSYSALTSGSTSPEFWKWYCKLPNEYRDFLSAQNGGFVEEDRYTFPTGVPFKSEAANVPSREDCLVKIFGIPTSTTLSSAPVDLLQMAAIHKEEGFLPSTVVAIARCAQNSLICLAISGDDVGTVYYWDWYWRYPWCKAYFDARVAVVLHRYPNADEILEDVSHQQHLEVADALNYATIVHQADSLAQWLRRCEDRRDAA